MQLVVPKSVVFNAILLFLPVLALLLGKEACDSSKFKDF